MTGRERLDYHMRPHSTTERISFDEVLPDDEN